MNKDDMIRKIEEEAAGIEIPASLSPEAVRQMLEEKGSQIRETYKDDPDVPKEEETPVLSMEEVRRKAAARARRRKTLTLAVSLAAAALVLAAGVRFFRPRMGSSAPASAGDAVYEEAVMTEEAEAETFNAPAKGSLEGSVKLSDYMTPAADYEEIYQAVREGQESAREVLDGVTAQAKEYEAVTEESPVENTAGAVTAADHSDTNIREEGVGEADRVKTDGSYIYSLSTDQTALVITAASGGDLSPVSEIRPDLGTGAIWEFYLSGDRLLLIGNYYKTSMIQTEEDTFSLTSLDQTHVITYDISDRKNPVQEGILTLDGYYNTIRFYDGFAYILTTAQSPFHTPLTERYEEEAFVDQAIPKVNGVPVAAGNIYCPGSIGPEPALTLTAMALDQPGQALDTKVFMGWTSDYYASKDAIYLEIPVWEGMGQMTNIVRISYEKGSITPVGVGTVPGYLESSFSIDQSSDGYLRAAVTSWTENGNTNGVYIFDRDMQLTGSLTGLAAGESIQSARFLEDILYLVTFRNTDPLFSIDVSDPKAPKLLGELKIPGFSDYLHFWGEKKLLGIGWDVDEETGETLGLKLSMFDISNPLSVKEEAVCKMANYWQCDGLYDYRQLLVDPGKNLIGFEAGCQVEKGDDWEWKDTYHVFSYENGSFQEQATLDLQEMGAYLGGRGIYIGDTFYLVAGRRITAFDMQSGFKKIGSI